MPFIIREKTYPMPKESSQPAPTGSEIISIEEHFDLDGLTLLTILGDENPSTLKGYSKTKALYALAWICMTRGGEIVSIQDVLDDYSVDEFVVEEYKAKKEQTAD
jgi:hypothetical protein